MKKITKNTGGRRSHRLPTYNYSQMGQYYITICTYQSKCIFGHINNHKMILNKMGHTVMNSWSLIPKYFPNTNLGAFVIMPNHIHGIIEIIDSITHEDINFGTAKTIGSIVRCLKSNVTKWARKNTNISEIWQRNYYEHIIRNDVDHERICEYIIHNPENWNRDKLYRDD